MAFITIPVVTWLVCGCLKFAVNSMRSGYAAFDKIGLGGFPSNHTAIISSIVWACALLGEWHLAGLALAVLMIHVFDALGLRRAVGCHAAAINQLTGSRFRETMGHTPLEVAAGLVVGLAVASGYWISGIIG